MIFVTIPQPFCNKWYVVASSMNNFPTNTNSSMDYLIMSGFAVEKDTHATPNTTTPSSPVILDDLYKWATKHDVVILVFVLGALAKYFENAEMSQATYRAAYMGTATQVQQ